MAAVVFGLSMAVTSCKDDDNDGDGNVSKEEEQIQQSLKAESEFWSVAGKLAGTSAYTKDWENKTYEPIYGMPVQGNAHARMLYVNSYEDAVNEYANIVNKELDANISSDEFKSENVGTLTFTKSTDGKSLATVDVQIDRMPSLEKIIYLTIEQAEDNSSFGGTAYYTFGDVVSKPNPVNKNQLDYWVCVRPCFGLEGKSESHWITLSPLPVDKVWSYTASTKTVYNLPSTAIGSNKKQMQNLAEMLYAMFFPYEWEQNVKASTKTPMFDLKNAHVEYYNQFFFRNVRWAWEKENSAVFKKVFGDAYASDALKNEIQNNGLNLLHYGLGWNDWWTSVSWNLTLHEAKYVINTTGAAKLLNMHDAHYNDVKKDVKAITDLDVTKLTSAKPYLVSEFFNKVPHWIIRYATGSELAGQNYNSESGAYSPFGNEVNQIKDVFVYNKFYNKPFGKSNIPFIEKDIAQTDSEIKIGSVLAKDGKFYDSRADAVKADAKPLCIVIYVSPADKEGNRKAVEEGLPYHGLAMGLEDAEIGQNYWFGTDEGMYCTGKLASAVFENVKDQLNGRMLTEQFKNHCGKDENENHIHPFVDVLQPYTQKFDIKNGVYTNVSDWFIPSVGQMMLAFESMGLKVDENASGEEWAEFIGKDGQTDCWNIMKNFLGENAAAFKRVDKKVYPYWLSTEASKTLAWAFEFNDKTGKLKFSQYDKHTTVYPSVRPFVLFGDKGK